MSEHLCNPRKLNIYLRSKSFEGNVHQTIRFYNVKHEKEPFSESLLQKITTPKVAETKKKLGLPPPNTFLPKSFDILEADPDVSKKPILLY